MTKVAIIKYNAGNTQSVIFALDRIGVDYILTDSLEDIKSADKVIFPGVGEAASTMNHLKKSGLDKLIPSLKQPVLGICLGMQLMCAYSEEGDTKCLGIFDIPVKKLIPEASLKVPHMGWNDLCAKRSILSNLQDDHMYFVHSYYVPVCDFTIGQTDYILPFSAALQKENFYAVQFHPEKSGKQGEQVLKNFLEL